MLFIQTGLGNGGANTADARRSRSVAARKSVSLSNIPRTWKSKSSGVLMECSGSNTNADERSEERRVGKECM